MKDFQFSANSNNRVWIELNPVAIRYNTRILVSHVAPASVIAVVKGSGYGHGLGLAAKAAREGGARWLAVDNVTEATLLRELSDTGPILCLSPPLPHETQAIVRANIETTITDVAQIEALADAARLTGRLAKVHLRVDTGIGYTGVSMGEFPRLLTQVEATKEVECSGVFSHMRNGSDRALSQDQAERFLAAIGCAPLGTIRHLCNSAAIPGGQAYYLDAVRPGLALFGLSPECAVFGTEPALSWRCQLLEVHHRPKGSTIGYKDGIRLARDSIVGVVPVGFWHGYPRGSAGPVLIHGRRAPIIGDVNMQSMAIGLTEIPEARPGDTVTLLGRDGNDILSVKDLCRQEAAYLIPNLFTCCISSHLPFVVKEEKVPK